MSLIPRPIAVSSHTTLDGADLAIGRYQEMVEFFQICWQRIYRELRPKEHGNIQAHDPFWGLEEVKEMERTYNSFVTAAEIPEVCEWHLAWGPDLHLYSAHFMIEVTELVS